MKEFFEVITLGRARELAAGFAVVGVQEVALADAHARVLAETVRAEADLPGFRRSTMDGYAVCAASTFGASESAPALLQVVGCVDMGVQAEGTVGPGQAAQILTGGMVPAGADAVVMVEHTEILDDTAIEVTRTVGPKQNVVEPDEDVARGEQVVALGTRLRAQEIGALAALGKTSLSVYRRPVVAIISTGDEVIPIDRTPAPGQVRDVNSSTMSSMVRAAGGEPRLFGIVADDAAALRLACMRAVEESDMVILSGGSSVGTRDLTLEVLSALPEAELLAHGVAIQPGKPTILARVGQRAFWGLPGHVTSAMVVFHALVRPALQRVGGVAHPEQQQWQQQVQARLTRNLASVHGRQQFVRVRLEPREDGLWAAPILGKSGLIRTTAESHGLVEIGENAEGVTAGTSVQVQLW